MTFTLRDKPLAEALLEIRWALLPGPAGPTSLDPIYPFLVGSLFDRLSGQYPVAERLPAADAPDEFTPYIVKHRLRVAEASWPVVQVGPGVATLNTTIDGYDWDDFRSRSRQLLSELEEIHKRHNHEYNIHEISLRFVNRFDQGGDDILAFFSGSLNLGVALPPALAFQPDSATIVIERDLPHLASVGAIVLAKGAVGDLPGVLLDLKIVRRGDGVLGAEECMEWLGAAHSELEQWFLAFIEGEMFKRLGGKLNE